MTDKVCKIELTYSQIDNLIEFLEMRFISHIREDEELDNMEYLVDMCEVYKKLKGTRTDDGKES